MHAVRRAGWNFALQRAADWARELKKPLWIVEPLGCGGRWDSARRHRFVLQGMTDNARDFEKTAAGYYPYLETAPGEAETLLRELARDACLIVGDDYPLPLDCDPESWGKSLPVRLEKVDGNGLLPLQTAPEAFPTAFSFRRFLQRCLRDYLLDLPKARPLARLKLPPAPPLTKTIRSRRPSCRRQLASKVADSLLEKMPLDRHVSPAETVGGPCAARAVLKRFLEKRLIHYCDRRNDVEEEFTSGLSPYLHFGHVSVHEIFSALARHESWTPDRLGEKPTGRREGWWGMGRPAEAFLDELVTWREIGLNFCWRRRDYDRYDSLPDWAKKTLAKHAKDARQYVYSLKQLERAETHDPLWNAAQRQLVREGRIPNYLRMLWGKKILEWSASPRRALKILIELNNRYALDGEDPNSYSGVFWVLGRYDRPWGPERPIFGTVRYMSSENTARKIRVNGYLQRFAAE
ncbi:MAG: deoxyribodipyrimidine photolyase [Pirellulales bacterium]|nr:deoxyribodipyrimidine photolyase [Pirellulales bacterium]